MSMRNLQAWLRSLRVALSLMTTIPVAYPENASAIEQRRSIYAYPIVGGIIGAILLGVASVSGEGGLLAAAILLLVWIILSGAIHLDGLADCADAWMAGIGDREKTLRLLKDPLCGSIAVVTLIITLLIKVAAINQILISGNLIGIFVIPVLARVTPLFLFWHLSYVRAEGLGSPLKTSADDRFYYWGAIGLTTALAAFLVGVHIVWILWLIALLVAAIITISERRLGGFTGDVAGAQIELVECLLCVAIAFIV